MKPRRQSLFLSTSNSTGEPPEGGKSLMRYLWPKSWKKKSVDIIVGDGPGPAQQPTSPTDPLLEQKCEYIRVVATVLHPQIFYKTLPITPHTTAYDVIVALVEKYAIAMEDQNPDCFYLTETQENEQGSYSRFLEHYEKVHNIQSRWRDGKNSCFTLCRTPKVPRNSFLLDSPLSPVGVAILSTSQDSCMSYSAFIESGCSPTISEVMSDFYFSVTSDGSSSASKPTSVSIESPREVTFGFRESAIEYPKFTPHGGRRIKSVRRGVRSNSNDILRRDSDGPLEDCVFTLPNQELIPPEGGEIILGSTESGYNSEENRPKQKETGAPRRNMRLLMQQSIDEGLSGIMNKVVTERRQLPSPRAHTVTSPVSVPNLQPLVCSPTQSAERRYPQFVFTPLQKSSVEKIQSEAVCQGKEEDELVESNGSVEHRDTFMGEKDAQDPTDTSDDHSQSDDTFQGTSNSITMDSSGNGLQGTFDSITMDSSGSGLQGTSNSITMDSSGSGLHSYMFFQDQVIDYLPYNHRKTSRATPSVLFETELIIYPHFQASAGLYPSFIRSDYFSSEMDMFESLSTLMAINFSGNGKDNNTARRRIVLSKGNQPSIESLSQRAPLVDTDIPHPTVSVLISPARRSRLIEQAAQAIKLKRSHSFNLDGDQSTRRDVDPVCLISSTRTDQLIQQAAWALRKTHSIQQHPKEEESQMDPALHYAFSHQDKTTGDFTGRHPSTPVLESSVSSHVKSYGSQSAPVESNTADEVPEHATGCGLTNEPIDCTDSNVHTGEKSLPDTTTEVLASGMSQSPSSSSAETMATVQSNEEQPLDVHCSPKHSVNKLLDTHNHSNLTPAHRSKSSSFVEATGSAKKKLSSELIDPKLSQSLLERSYKSMEVLAGVNGEILCTSSAKRRPITLLVCNKGSSESIQSLTTLPHTSRQDSIPNK